MKQYRYEGLFTSFDGFSFTLNVYAISFHQAAILLVAKAIEEGLCNKLVLVTDESNISKAVTEFTISFQ